MRRNRIPLDEEIVGKHIPIDSYEKYRYLAAAFMKDVYNDLVAEDPGYSDTVSLMYQCSWEDIIQLQGIFAHMFNIFTAVVEGESDRATEVRRMIK